MKKKNINQRTNSNRKMNITNQQKLINPDTTTKIENNVPKKNISNTNIDKKQTSNNDKKSNKPLPNKKLEINLEVEGEKKTKY